jgi:hypothetical protein
MSASAPVSLSSGRCFVHGVSRSSRAFEVNPRLPMLADETRGRGMSLARWLPLPDHGMGSRLRMVRIDRGNGSV